MARYFRAGRGRALGIAGLGHPLGEAVLPLPAVALAALIGWRVSWALVAALMIFAALPVALWLLRGHAERQRNWLDHRVPEARHTGGVEIKWTRAEVVRDPVFYYLLPASLASSYVMTGFFFHQAHLAQTKGWPLTLIAGSFTAWALASVVAALITGDLVDRRGATRMMPFALVPMCAGLAALSATDSPLAAPVYLGSRGYLPGRAHDRAGRPVGRDLRRAPHRRDPGPDDGTRRVRDRIGTRLHGLVDRHRGIHGGDGTWIGGRNCRLHRPRRARSRPARAAPFEGSASLMLACTRIGSPEHQCREPGVPAGPMLATLPLQYRTCRIRSSRSWRETCREVFPPLRRRRACPATPAADLGWRNPPRDRIWAC